MSSRWYSVAAVFAALPLSAIEWDHVRPKLKNEAQALTEQAARALLGRFCDAGLGTDPKFGLTCKTTAGSKAFADIIDAHFHPESVIYGNFLSPAEESAAVSGWSTETHPSLWKGTLLLTRRNGVWTPLWYKSSVVTHSCRKLRMPAGREILLCEVEDAGMGHTVHYLAAVDFTQPQDIRNSLVASAQSLGSECVEHKQEFGNIRWEPLIHVLSIELLSPIWRKLTAYPCAADPGPGKRPPRAAHLKFTLTDAGLRRDPDGVRYLRTRLKDDNLMLQHTDGREIRAPKLRGLTVFRDATVSPDGRTVGWLAGEDAGTLVLFRNDRILRTFATEQVFWAWAFRSDGEQVAYCTGPTHGGAAECLLRNVSTGQTIEQWNPRDGGDSPAWAAELHH